MKMLPALTDLTLVLTDQCNLRCPYCYVPRPAEGRGAVMSREVALTAVDALLDQAPRGRGLSISFFGGEPFLARELMQQVVDHAQARRPEGLSFSAPTNGTLLDDEALALVRSCGMNLALSVDGVTASARRPDANGQSSSGRLRQLLPLLADMSPMVRMTVTPHNVDDLCDNITALYSWGARRIMHQPALEQPWPEEAVQRWREQHQRLADWAYERYAAHQDLPDLTVLEGITQRLCGAAMSYCGAGVTQAAVAPDGRLYGCFRSVFDPRAERLALGHVLHGEINEPLVAAYARLHPHRARPEGRESCQGCEARDGCTVYCAATGQLRTGDLRGVSADACALMQAQVAVCRDLLRRMRQVQRASRRQASARVAAATLALGLGLGASGCEDDRALKQDSGPPPDKGQLERGTPDYQIPGNCDAQAPDSWPPDGFAPGVCPKPQDGGPQPGVCPVKPDLGPDSMPPGLCPPPLPDGGPKPGLCPIKPDGGPKPGVCPPPPPKDGGPQPGVCPVKVDGGPKPGVCPPPPPKDGGPQPGLCPVKVDWGSPKKDSGNKKDGGPGPGLCPMPGVC